MGKAGHLNDGYLVSIPHNPKPEAAQSVLGMLSMLCVASQGNILETLLILSGCRISPESGFSSAILF